MEKQITVIKFLKIDKSIAKLNMKNKDVLEQNASQKYMLITDKYVSEKSYQTLSNIARKIMRVKEHETLLKMFIKKAPICDDDDEIEIDIVFCELEKDITEDMNMSDFIKKINNNQLNSSLN